MEPHGNVLKYERDQIHKSLEFSLKGCKLRVGNRFRDFKIDLVGDDQLNILPVEAPITVPLNVMGASWAALKLTFFSNRDVRARWDGNDVTMVAREFHHHVLPTLLPKLFVRPDELARLEDMAVAGPPGRPDLPQVVPLKILN
jgi:hypothetical protein